MKYPMIYQEKRDEYEDTIEFQKVSWDYDNFKGDFRVWNLWDCPEDACIGRDLFGADDFIEAVRFGMDLARKGYDDIELTEKKIEYEE